MTSQQILKADFLDILFDHRNKEYGAYALRKSYPMQMTKALFIAFPALFILLLIMKPSLSHDLIESDKSRIVVTDYPLTPINKPKPPEPPKLPQNKFPPSRQQTFVDLKIVDKENLMPIADMEKLLQADVSNVTTNGEPPSTNNTIDPARQGNVIVEKPAEPKKELVPDRQPQYPGGMKAWADFLNRNLHAPQDLESGEKRLVNIRFHVDVNGSITNFQILLSGGAAFDNEVIRVLKKMPKWVPAMKGGQPIAAMFTQPVTFVGIEE